MSLKKTRFCIFCGQAAKFDSPADACAHEYHYPLQVFLPCRALYHEEANWFLYTVDNQVKTVFMDRQELNTKSQVSIGTGGIVLRDPQLIFKSWELKNAEKILQYLSVEFDISSTVGLELISIFWHFNDLFASQTSAWSIDDIYFEDNCPKLPLIENSILMEILDKLDEHNVTDLLKLIYIHGRWEALNVI